MAIRWEICGNKSGHWAFWDNNYTIATQTPDLTQCFQNTVLAWVPCGALWLSAPFYSYVLLGKDRICKSWWHMSRLSTWKMFLATLLLLLALLDLFKTVSDNAGGLQAPTALLITPFIRAITMALAIFFIYQEFTKGFITSGVMFIFWLLTVVTAIVPLRSYILHIKDDVEFMDTFREVTFYVGFSLSVIQFVLVQFVDLEAQGLTSNEELPEERQPLLSSTKSTDSIKSHQLVKEYPCPQLTSSFFSRLTFWWFSRTMIITGWKKTLVSSDLWDLRPADRSLKIINDFQQAWKEELGKAKKKLESSYKYVTNGYNVRQSVGTYDIPPSMPSPNMSEVKDDDKKLNPSLIWALCRSCGSCYIIAGIAIFLFCITQVAKPLLLQLLLDFIQFETQFEWQGYMIAVIMFANSMLSSILIQNHFYNAYLFGQRLRSAVTAAVYRKALKLTSTSRKTATVGEIVNLMSVDAQKLQDAPNLFHYLWSSSLLIIVVTAMLWQILGVAALAGLVIMSFIAPFNTGYVGSKIKGLQTIQMKEKDERIKLTSEILNGIKVLKMYAWEPSFSSKILSIREKELKVLQTAAFLNACTTITFFIAPYLVSLCCFAVYVLSDPKNVLDAQKAFVSIALVNILTDQMSALPQAVSFMVQALVSLKRITKFLMLEEQGPGYVQRDDHAREAVQVTNGYFSWERDQSPTLKRINLKVAPGSLIAVVGQVGSGKSSLMSALLGEMYKTDGTVNVKGKLAYVAQQAWIQNLTLRDNILFGKDMNVKLYQRIINACALGPDLKILTGGDMTEIGEKGLNLSGGQKQRVSLARAVYQDLDIYLFDDPLSAVDAHVGKHIFEQVVGPTGILHDKTRILVTHSISFLKDVDKIVVLKDGHISEMDTYDNLLKQYGAFADFIKTYLTENQEEIESMSETDPESAAELRLLRQRVNVLSGEESTDMTESDASVIRRQRRKHRKNSRKSDTSDRERLQKKHSTKVEQLIEEEQAEKGSVKLSVIKYYVNAGGNVITAVGMTALLLFTAAQVGTNFWLSEWSGDTLVNGTQDLGLRDMRLGVYGALGVGQCLSIFVLAICVAFGSVSASRILHKNLLNNTVKNPMSFFDTTPMGRIINRFSKEMDIIDVNIPQYVQLWLIGLSPFMATLVVIIYSTPIFLTVVLPLGIIFVAVQRLFTSTARQLKRIDSIKRSPIYSHFSETLTGVSSIRAYRQSERFIEKSDKLLDESQSAWYAILVAYRWISMYLNIVGSFVELFAAVFAVMSRGTISAGLAGLSVSYSQRIMLAMILMVRAAGELETYVVSVERIREYSQTPNEAPWRKKGKNPPKGWPHNGVVKFNDYSTRYRPGLDLVVKGITADVNPDEKIGIVGRTGAGKSSLTLALFRIIEAAGGSICIDGLDIADMGLHDVRPKITIIPQDPVIFSGTMRMNLDPSDEYSDDQIWQSLEHAHLKSYISGQNNGLDFECGEEGSNLSVGQRQLVCLARALLRKTKILVLDEATAAVDLETDDLIQNTIRTSFKDCTVLTIAHRLNTIMDYDRVMVLDAGKLKEYDSPSNLLKNKRGIFFGMSKDAGLI
ncbi:unnamed protein product [Owenia fusiformis]|uniref:ABC-type glutathione-S-conjugate transporter n=1 Tax=Owenia fusiformis TaxID=6347 RepID=A0A8J1XWW9_OWEFU|nr:unnamed protein product [Owenia fusiformis]